MIQTVEPPPIGRHAVNTEAGDDGNGKRIRESAFTEDWKEAQRKLRERLQARDDRILEIVRKGEELQFSTWADFFLGITPNRPFAQKRHTRPICGQSGI